MRTRRLSVLGWCLASGSALTTPSWAADAAPEDTIVLSARGSQPAPTPAMHAHEVAVQHWLLSSIAWPAVAEEDAGRQAELRRWSEDWCCRVAGLEDDTSPASYRTSLQHLMAAGCRAPVALYAYARLLQGEQRHQEARYDLQQAAQILGDRGNGYLTFLVFLSLFDEEDVAFQRIAKQGQARAVARLLAILQDPGAAPLEQGIIGTLLQRDYFRETILTGPVIPMRTIECVAQQMDVHPSVGSPWFRAMVAAVRMLERASALASNGASTSTEVAAAIAEVTTAWNADPRWTEPAIAALEAATLDRSAVDVAHWVQAGLRAGPGSNRVLNAFFGAIDADDGGHQHLLRFAQEALATRLFDTPVPALHLQALLYEDRQLQGLPDARHAWWNAQRWQEVQELVNGELGTAHSDPNRDRYWETIRIAAAVRCGVETRQRHALRATLKDLDPWALDQCDVEVNEIDGPQTSEAADGTAEP